MIIEFADYCDLKYIYDKDKHVFEGLLDSKIANKEILIIKNDENNYIGWLRYGYFWDNTPFMNMIWIEEENRSKGLGKKIVMYWEEEMKRKGFNLVMTSTLANEQAQHFYRKMGYKDSGSLLLENEPLEILFVKKI